MSEEIYNATADYLIKAAGNDFLKYLMQIKWKMAAGGY